MGGNAFPMAGKVHKSEVTETVLYVTSLLKLNEYRILGSTGKKEFSGDIDIAVNISPEDLMRKLEKHYGKDMIRRYGNVHSILVPIQGYSDTFVSERRTGLVQVDFIIGDIEWLDLFYFWDDSSKLKGTHRNIALSTLAMFVGYKEYTSDVDDQGRCADYCRYKWSPVDGLVYVNCKTPKDKFGNFRKTQQITKIRSSVYDKETIASILFSGKLSGKYMDSAESVIEAIQIVFKDEPARLSEILLELYNRFETNHNVGSYFDLYPQCIQDQREKIEHTNASTNDI